jgi:hypothetical protein
MFLQVLVQEFDPTQVSVTATLTDVSTPLDRKRLRNNKYALDGGDTLRACLGAQCVQLSPDRNALLGNIESYSGLLPFAADTPYVVSFSRPAATSAINTTVTLAPAINITEPAYLRQFTDGQSIRLSWWPIGASENIAIEKITFCRSTNSESIEDPTSTSADAGHDGHEDYSIDELVAFAKVVSPTWPANSILDCYFNFNVTQERSGTVDPNFRGGEVIGLSERHVSANYVPTP